MSTERALTIPEELMLLALEERSGRTHGLSMFSYALSGGIAAELILRERVRLVSKGKRNRVEAASARRTHQPILDAALDRIRASKRARSLQGWVQHLASTRSLKHDVALGLCRKGVLRTGEEKVLLVFTRKLYPELDPGPEREVVERMRRAVFEDGEVDARTAILVGIASKVGLLKVPFDRKLLKGRKQRIDSLGRGDASVAATSQAIAAVQVAIMASMTAAIAASTAAGAS